MLIENKYNAIYILLIYSVVRRLFDRMFLLNYSF